MRSLSILFLSILLCTCGKIKENTATAADSLKTDSIKTETFDYNSQFKLENYLINERSLDTSKIQTITADCAILIYPTDEQIEEMKKTEGEEDFYVGADDSNFYQAQASQTIDSVGVTIKTATKQFLKFNGNQKTWLLNIRKKNLPAWNLIFFNRNKSPEVVPTIMLTKEKVKSYFEK